MTALKGQWRRLILGVFLSPLFLGPACLRAQDDSVLGRRRARRSLAT